MSTVHTCMQWWEEEGGSLIKGSSSVTIIGHKPYSVRAWNVDQSMQSYWPAQELIFIIAT